MIAIDTNVLLRYLFDDQIQAVKAGKLINGKEIILITDVVLVETIWTLKGKKYQLAKTDFVVVIQALFKEPNIRFEKAQVVWMALNDYRKTKSIDGRFLRCGRRDPLTVRKEQVVFMYSNNFPGGTDAFYFNLTALR